METVVVPGMEDVGDVDVSGGVKCSRVCAVSGGVVHVQWL